MRGCGGQSATLRKGPTLGPLAHHKKCQRTRIEKSRQGRVEIVQRSAARGSLLVFASTRFVLVFVLLVLVCAGVVYESATMTNVRRIAHTGRRGKAHALCHRDAPRGKARDFGFAWVDDKGHRVAG